MAIKNKGYIPKEEAEFITNVTKAVLKKDVSLTHFLLNAKGVMRYETASIDKSNIEFEYDEGGLVKIVCIFSKYLIEDFHFKASNDELSEAWIRRAVKSVIEHGKEIAEVYYDEVDS
ncbi:hypothetical protein GCM10011351_28390 [Paraliobacillus quinghaiensis]|uniref:Uncharacterized protein n=1 Tax=Paraliobacillus quinghaiensis TaxID=470815 RepID=A0A917TW79_9BACI|nr:hypothetical protein [Paraliobacillus quinghaiensis]GGM40536.1 hypothetical protein GCM10011351_28390 [Paraliobacillus quinghaiensis]